MIMPPNRESLLIFSGLFHNDLRLRATAYARARRHEQSPAAVGRLS